VRGDRPALLRFPRRGAGRSPGAGGPGSAVPSAPRSNGCSNWLHRTPPA